MLLRRLVLPICSLIVTCFAFFRDGHSVPFLLCVSYLFRSLMLLYKLVYSPVLHCKFVYGRKNKEEGRIKRMEYKEGSRKEGLSVKER